MARVPGWRGCGGRDNDHSRREQHGDESSSRASIQWHALPLRTNQRQEQSSV
jgi:hypothetical protein